MTRIERALGVFGELRKVITEPETELEYANEWQLLVAVLLSAQCTDARVNMVTPALFERFPDAASTANGTQEEVFSLIRSISYPNSKARHMMGAAVLVEEKFGGNVPQTVKELVELPGVGNKTAQVVASVAFGVPTLAVDTHVFRVANRIGLVGKGADTPEKVEKKLKSLLPSSEWGEIHHLLILHGRYHCTARNPGCSTCVASKYCDYFERLGKLPTPLSGLDARRGKFFCATRKHYFEEPDLVSDRHDVEQISCPRCGSMNVFLSKTGNTTKKIKDFRV